MENVFARLRVLPRGEDDGDVLVFRDTERDIARFAVVMANILRNHHWPAENAGRPQQIESAFRENASTLRFTPGKPFAYVHLCVHVLKAHAASLK